MVNARSRLFILIMLFLPWNLISAFPRLAARGDCDSIVCPSVFLNEAGALWNGAGEIFGAGLNAAGTLAGWTINHATGLFEPPATGAATSNADSTPETPNAGPSDATLTFGANPGVDKANTNAFDPSLASEPDLETGLIKPLLSTGECDSAPPPLLDINSNQGFVSLGITKKQGCDKTTAQIVWPVSCEDTEANLITGNILRGMDPGVLASADSLCAIEGGIAFWVLQLTPDQIEQLKTEQKQSIRAIEANASIEPLGVLIRSDLKRRDNLSKVSPAEKKGRYDKRDTVIKQQDLEDVPRLRFISSINNYNAKSYAYFSPAGAGITVYVVDTGLNDFNHEFASVKIKLWLIALGADPTLSDPPSSRPKFHGSCMASLVTGRLYGVSKKVDLIVVKITNELGSLNDGLSKIVQYVKEQARTGKRVAGYSVVNISWGLRDFQNFESSLELMEKYIKELSEKYQVVVVVASGQDFKSREQYPDISMWPAKFSLTTDIITVGAVKVTDGEDNGQRYEWSAGGDALTISAPGEASCASGEPGDAVALFRGTSVAAGTLTGLVAYFLSLPIGDRMRGSPDTKIPAAMKQYVLGLSFPRFGTSKALSNGLDGDSDKMEWTRWFGSPDDYKIKF